MDLTDKIALVTGGSRGIGRAACLSLAQAGADVVVNYFRNQEAANEVVHAIQDLGRRAIAVKADVGNQRETEAMFARLDEAFGRIDILVNNAGTGLSQPLEKLTVDAWNNLLNTYLTGPFLCTQAAANRMIPRKYGRIVNVSSIAGVRGMELDPAYSAAKAGLLGFTKSVARYLGKHNITVNAIAPGPTITQGVEHVPEEVMNKNVQLSALGRPGKPEDIADAIRFFASDDSRHVTGQMILVDGGIIMP